MITNEKRLSPSSSFNSLLCGGSCNPEKSVTSTRYPVYCRTPTPYLSRRIYYPVREVEDCNIVANSNLNAHSQRTISKERFLSPTNGYSYEIRCPFITPFQYYGRCGTHEFSQICCAPVTLPLNRRKNSSPKLRFDPFEDLETDSGCSVDNGLSPSVVSNGTLQCWNRQLPLNYRDRFNCMLPYEKCDELFEMNSIATNMERNQNKQLSSENKWLTPRRTETIYSSSFNVCLRRHSHSDAHGNYDPLLISTHHQKYSKTATAGPSAMGNTSFASLSYDAPTSDSEPSGNFVSYRNTSYTVNKAQYGTGRKKRPKAIFGSLDGSDKIVENEIYGTCLPKTANELNPNCYVLCAPKSSLEKPATATSEARIKIGCPKKLEQDLVGSSTNAASRVRPPLPPNPPSQSRLLRYSQSVNERRKQKICISPSQSLNNEFIDGFQSNEQRRVQDPRLRQGPPRGGHPMQGRSGITSAGTTPNVNMSNLAASGKKKKSKKEKKSKLSKRDISNPTNFQHKAHVGWDASGGFSQETYDADLMDSSVRDLLRAAGENPDRMTKDEIDFTYHFLNQYQKAPEAMEMAPPPAQHQRGAQGQAAPPPPARRDAAAKGQKVPAGPRPARPAQPPAQVAPQGPRPSDMPPAPPAKVDAAPEVALPPVASSAPPPPPPPSVESIAPISVSIGGGGGGKGDLLSQIRAGANLKSAAPGENDNKDSGASRDDVMAQIRQGTVLKRVDRAALEEKKITSNLEDIGGIAGALAKALKDIREKVHDSEESSEDDDENNDDEWASD